MAETELAAVALDESQRKADSVQIANPPDDPAEIELHNLTHLPYQAWCPACVMAKGKPEQHRSDPSKLVRREHPIISWDFCYTGKSCEGLTEDAKQSKLTALVVHASHSGAVHCIPVQHKSQIKYMSQEIMRFITFLAYSVVMLRCDQEPSTLQIQKMVQRARQRLNLRTVVEDAKVGDHGSNSAVEKAIDRIRNQASVFLHALTAKIGFQILPQHPLFAWAFTHAGWTLTRFTVKTTPFELISGHTYNAKLCAYGCPVMVFVGDTTQQKGDAKWQRGIFLTKTLSNDMFLTAVGGALRLSRSIKMLYPNWNEHLEEYRQVLTFPWQMEGAIGSRTFPVVRGELVSATAVPGLDDEAAADPEDDELPPCAIDDLVPVATSMRRLPPPPTAVVSAPVTVPSTPDVSQLEATEQRAFADEGIEQVGQPAPSLQAPGPVTPGMETTVEVEMFGETIETGEPDAKRARLSAMPVGSETLVHVDEDPGELLQQCDTGDFSFSMEAACDETCGIWDDDNKNFEREMTEDDLWQPQSSLEPMLDGETLQRIDDYADSVEIDRLLGMKVIQWHSNYNGVLGTQLSAKFVRSWRKKVRKIYDENGKLVAENPGWRRSRLVAREFNWLDVREDVYSPSSSSSIVKLLPALAMSDGFCKSAVLGTLDVADAFLQVPQPVPRVVKIGNLELVILMCLPGPRDAAKLWYQHFTNVLQKKFGATICVEQPCVKRIQRKCAMVLHVDDVLFLGEQQWLSDVFLPGLKEEFKLSSTLVDRSAKTPCNTSSTATSLDAAMEKPLSETLSVEFRSLVGIAMYVSQELFDLQFATKSLANYLKSPTKRAWVELGRLVGYMKFSERFALRMRKTSKGSSFQGVMFGNESETETRNNLIETYSDSDWSNRSTSAAVHVLNGIVIWPTSKTQKCISLSSTEAEWYAATSAVCDSLFLHHILSFLTDDEVGPVILHTDNSAVKMLSNKLGAGRLRHIKGRLLWLQAKVLSGDLCIKQVKTLYNIADLNTKSLAKDRHLFLLHMLGFVCSGEKVGETEFTRVQAKEMLKQQVNMVIENFSEQTGQLKTSRTNRMAKQFLRALSVFSVMSLAEGHGIANVSQLVHGVSNALSWWCGTWSPINIFSIVLLFLMAVLLFVHMTPGSGSGPSSGSADNRSRSRSRIDLEPGAEPPTSRYPANPRSLGMKYPNVCPGENFRPEGVLYWLCDRAGKRIVRGNRILTNNMRKGGLQQMLKLCLEGLSPEDRENMIDNVRSMTDLTDDEYSPRYMCSEETVMCECEQGVRAFDIAAEMVRRMEEEAENGEVIETEEGRYDRYMRSELDDVSDPGYWHDIRAEPEDEHSGDREHGESDEMASDPETTETFEEKKHRYALCERHEALDEELWQQLHDARMQEIQGEEHLEGPALDFRFYMEQEGENERNEPHY